MYKLILVFLLIPMSSLALTKISADDLLGIGTGYSGDYATGNQCVNGVVNKTYLSKPIITYSLRKEDQGTQVKVVAEILIIDSILTFDDVNSQKMLTPNTQRFFDMCGDSYLSKVTRGASFYKAIFVTKEDASKISEVQIVEADVSAANLFFDIYIRMMTGVQPYGISNGYFSAPNNIFTFDTKASLLQVFNEYRAYVLANPSASCALFGETTPYPEFIKR